MGLSINEVNDIVQTFDLHHLQQTCSSAMEKLHFISEETLDPLFLSY